MATSGSKTSEALSWIDLKFSWWQISQSINTNSTEIGWKMEAITGGGAVYVSNRTWTVSIDGKSYTGKVNVRLDENSTQTLASGTATIVHNADGSKTFAYSFTQQFEFKLNSGKWMGTYSGSSTGTLDTIPSGSIISVPNGELRTEQTITVTQKHSSFTHSIKAVCGDDTFYLDAYGISSPTEVIHNKCSVVWKPPISLAAQYPQSESVIIAYTITTYNSGVKIGEATTTATYMIPADIVPPILPTTSDPTDNADYYGAYVQGKSKVKLDFTTYGVYGSWIKSWQLVLDGKTYPTTDNPGSINGNTISIVTETIMGSGEIPVIITVTDSRERTTVDEFTVSVLPYEPPTITDLSAYRSDNRGVAVSHGDHLTVNFSTFVHALNDKNGAWFKIVCRKSGATEETTFTLDSYTGQFEVTDGTFTFAADPASYDIVLKVGDRFSTTPKSVAGASAIKTFSFLKKAGKIVGMAWGKLAEFEDVFDIAFQTRFNGGILHPVLPTNSDLDMELTPKTYMLLSANSYTNTPETGIGMFLEIVGIKDGSLIQRCSIFDREHPRAYERIHYSATGWGEWICVRGDFVIEQGETETGWTYRKWNSGVGECWKILEHKTKISKTWGSMYVGNTMMERQNYPFPFLTKPVEVASLTSGNPGVWLFTESQGNGVNGAYASAIYNVCRPTSNGDENTFYISLYATGKWK